MTSSSMLLSSSLRTTPLVVVRASSSNNGRNRVEGIRGTIDRATKITREQVLKNQEENESEKRSVLGAIPSSSSPYPRPEVERRPETGDKSFASLMSFDGAGPETMNGRLAMVGLLWAFLAERATGMTVSQQLYSYGSFGLFNFLALTQLVTYASLVPMLGGESPDSRCFGPFTAMAERWNGRTAMLGFLALVTLEAFRNAPLFAM